jgi:spore germination protein YaaH
MNLQGPIATVLRHALHIYHTNALWQEVNQVSHPLVMIVMMIVMVRESPQYAIQFFEDVCTKQKAQLKTLKNKLLSSQNDYKCLLEKFETFANLNCELTTKIEHLESKASSSTTDDCLVKKNEKLKAKLASSQNTIENLLQKMEIFSIHNNELTTKLENIGIWAPSDLAYEGAAC